ncbi:MAG: hypothetical protein SGJ05_05340 [bacterium]|nr:hypothetical protein [bacterium]
MVTQLRAVKTQLQSTSALCRSTLGQVRSALAIVVLALLVLSCQTPTQPDDIVIGDGFPVEAFVTDQGGRGVANARVQWTFVQRGTAEAVMLSSFTTEAARNQFTSANGQVTFVIPVPIAKEGTQVLFKVTAPAGNPDFAGRQQFGDFLVDTAVVCDTTVLRFELRKEVSVSCGSAPACSDIDLFIEPPLTTLDTAEQGDFVVPANAVVVRSLTFTPALPTEIRFEVLVNNVVVAMPANVPANTRFKIRFIGGPATTARQIDDSYNVNLVVENTNGTPCWNCGFNLRYRVIPTTPCDCPPIRRDTVPRTPDTVCVGDRKDSTFALNISNPNQDCDLIYELDTDSLTEPFAEVRLTGLGNSGGTSVSIPPSGVLSDISIRFEPLARRPYLQRFYFRVSRNTPTGIVPCADPLIVYYRGQGGLPICVIDSAASTIFRRVGANFRIDTLRNCLGIVDSLATKTLVIRNDGECELTVDLTSNNSQFTVSPGSIVLKGGERRTMNLRFKPTQADVYPGGRCTQPQYVQNTRLDIVGCSITGIDLVGRASTEQECANKQPFVAFKYDTTDVAGSRWRTVIDILADNRVVITDNKRTTLDSVAVFVQSLTVSGISPGGTVNSATLSSGPGPTGGCWVQYAKVATGVLFLPQDICDLFQQYGCGPLPAFSCTANINTGDILIFQRGSYYGIMWIQKLDWANTSTQALPQVEAVVCYPFN